MKNKRKIYYGLTVGDETPLMELYETLSEAREARRLRTARPEEWRIVRLVEAPRKRRSR